MNMDTPVVLDSPLQHMCHHRFSKTILRHLNDVCRYIEAPPLFFPIDAFDFL